MDPLPSGAWRWIRVLWLLAGGAFTVSRVARDGADTTAIAGLVFTFSVFVLPLIKGLKLPGGTELELQPQKIDQLSTKYDDLVDNVSSLLVSYTSSIAATDAVLAASGTIAAKNAFAFLKCAKVIDEALRWFAVAEPVRVLVYRYREAGVTVSGLYFVTGNVDEDEAAILKRAYFLTSGSDPVPRCWQRQRIVNLPETAAGNRPEVLRSHGITYHGMMVVPLRHLDDAWGVLIVERRQPIAFDVIAERVATALGNVVVATFAHPALVEALTKGLRPNHA
ncbi:MAG: hypothetical protein QOF71_1443 [Candidatus Eremiobacteraeota bacterium]|jgi:GAF domain-containing protein|nr:hypothetical protein [Candidatus Eremiobacteraeota bacterium]